MTRELLIKATTVVIKVGSSLLADLKGGINQKVITSLVNQLAGLKKSGKSVLLVSSGAVAAGTAELGLAKRPTDLPVIQAAAAVGQIALMQLYRELFGRHGVKTGQVLLTRDGLKDRQRFLHARQALLALLEHGVIPIINENDTVAVEELKLKMGDNDLLGVCVAQLVDADSLVILTDVPGLYDRPPSDDSAELISHVSEVTQQMLAANQTLSTSGSGLGMGGMATKLNAALAANVAGIPLVVAAGKEDGILTDIFSGKNVGTFFSPREKRVCARHQWIAFGRPAEGTITVDDGAEKAITDSKKSLLAIGIKAVDGGFAEADTIRIINSKGEEIARGLSNFNSEDLKKIRGTRSEEHSTILGTDCYDTVVHRDNLVVLH